jgi:hypothetical protein
MAQTDSIPPITSGIVQTETVTPESPLVLALDGEVSLDGNLLVPVYGPGDTIKGRVTFQTPEMDVLQHVVRVTVGLDGNAVSSIRDFRGRDNRRYTLLHRQSHEKPIHIAPRGGRRERDFGLIIPKRRDSSNPDDNEDGDDAARKPLPPTFSNSAEREGVVEYCV